jgi:carbonic anhydrase
MSESKSIIEKMSDGYHLFRDKYVHGDSSIMSELSKYGQKPQIMVVACCDSRVDPAVILQCEPGDLFVVRNVANIVPPYEKDEKHHGTSAALEFGIRFLEIEHLILIGHSQCGGMQALFENNTAHPNDFITNWVSVVGAPAEKPDTVDDLAKLSLEQSYRNCMSFPWIAEKVAQKKLNIHLWLFDIKLGQIFQYSASEKSYQPL